MVYKDVRKIMVLGDSVSKGVILSQEKGRYSFSPHRFLDRLSGDISPVFLDHSKFGTTTAHGKALLETFLHREQPDLILIEYGSNDSDYAWNEVAEDPHGIHLPHLSLQSYTHNLEALISASRKGGALPVLTNLHPLSGNRYFEWFTKGDPEIQRRTMIWLKDIRNIYWWQEMYSYAAEKTARKMGAPIVNIRGAFLSQPNIQSLLCADGIHPNEAGHELMYRTFLTYIRRFAPAWLEDASRTNG